jgi:nitroreductase
VPSGVVGKQDVGNAAIDRRVEDVVDPKRRDIFVFTQQREKSAVVIGMRVGHHPSADVNIGRFTAQAAELGLGSCILGWFDDEKVRAVTGAVYPTRLVITLGYPSPSAKIPEKKRKGEDELFEIVTLTD